MAKGIKTQCAIHKEDAVMPSPSYLPIMDISPIFILSPVKIKHRTASLPRYQHSHWKLVDFFRYLGGQQEHPFPHTGRELMARSRPRAITPCTTGAVSTSFLTTPLQRGHPGAGAPIGSSASKRALQLLHSQEGFRPLRFRNIYPLALQCCGEVIGGDNITMNAIASCL